MVSRKKKTQTYEDQISKLHDHMICQILSHLPTKDVVRTSLLSTRWKTLWQNINALDLESHKVSDIKEFVGFVDRFFHLHRDFWIQKLCLTTNYYTTPHLTSWIDTATRLKIQHLDIRLVCGVFCDIPLRLYTCETLVHLHLHGVTLVDAEFVSLPCLKLLHLSRNQYPNEDILEKLINGSPILEDLAITRNVLGKATSLRVISPTIKRIHIDKEVQVVIDAPLLQYFKTECYLFKKFRIIRSCKPTKVDIHFGYTSEPNEFTRRMILNVLTDFSKVNELVIHCFNWKAIFTISGSEPLLPFYNLTRLSARICYEDLEMLPNLLTICPKLESLVLELVGVIIVGCVRKNYNEPKVTFSTATPCMVSSLKFVELKSPIIGYDGEIELVRYFLKNSKMLEKFSLRIKDKYRGKKKDVIVKELLAMPRCSNACQLFLL
ncbi:unnamed protein product [Cochlearia groenlandica]